MSAVSTATGEYACIGGNDIDADMNVLKLNVVLKATLFCVSQAWSGIFWLLVGIPFLLSLDDDLNRHRWLVSFGFVIPMLDLKRSQRNRCRTIRSSICIFLDTDLDERLLELANLKLCVSKHAASHHVHEDHVWHYQHNAVHSQHCTKVHHDDSHQSRRDSGSKLRNKDNYEKFVHIWVGAQ